MVLSNVLAVLITLTAVFSYVNYRYVRLPASISVMLVGLVVSVVLVALSALGLPLETWAEAWLKGIDFDETVLNGMLSFLLFAGALHIDVNALLERRLIIGALSTIGTLLSAALVGTAAWAVFGGLGLPVSSSARTAGSRPNRPGRGRGARPPAGAARPPAAAPAVAGDSAAAV
jgi:CPA1 family monovalent cation:H+ antiporter